MHGDRRKERGGLKLHRDEAGNDSLTGLPSVLPQVI